MTQSAFFSIIVPTKDRAPLLKACINSIINQNYQHFELIIIDDGSEDNTADVVNSFGDDRIIYYYQNKKDKSSARNKGIELSSANYICFVDDDDLLLPDYLLHFNSFLQKSENKGIILRTGYYKQLPDGKQNKMPLYNSSYKNPVHFASFNMCGIWSLCIPRSFLETDQFPPGFPHWQDTHLILRLLAKHPFKQLNDHQYIYRIHDGRGSVQIASSTQLEKRCLQNVAAIKDFFKHYSSLVESFLPSNTLDFLVAQKHLQYALLAKNSKFKTLATKLYKQSTSQKTDWRLWKEYVLYFLF